LQKTSPYQAITGVSTDGEKFSKELHVKAKKGQILVLVLILMAVGLIVMAPLLSYLNTSYNIYAGKLNDTAAYYTVDAMIGKIFSDMYAGNDSYILNISDSTRYNNQSAGGWLNGYKISTSIINSINNSIAVPLPPPSGSGGEADWIYLDPGCSFGLNSLAYNAIHTFNMSITGGTTITVNWYFNDARSKPSCDYSAKGRMWITNSSTTATVCGSSSTDLNVDNTAFQQQLIWTVPQNGSAIYSIKFQNRATRETGSSCSTNTPRSMSDFSLETIPPGRPTFSGAGTDDPTYLNHTWVSIGNSSGGGVYLFNDYTITTTAKLASTNTNIVTVTACVRQTPGPSMWWEHQRLAVVSWIVTYY
jgi:hypothetical protein